MRLCYKRGHKQNQYKKLFKSFINFFFFLFFFHTIDRSSLEGPNTSGILKVLCCDYNVKKYVLIIFNTNDDNKFGNTRYVFLTEQGKVYSLTRPGYALPR